MTHRSHKPATSGVVYLDRPTRIKLSRWAKWKYRLMRWLRWKLLGEEIPD